MSQGRQIPTRPWRRGRRRRRRLREPLEEVRGSAIPSFSGGHVRPCLFVSLDPFSWHPPSIRLRQPPRVDPRRPVGARRRDRSPAAAARATVVRGGSAFSLCRSLCDRLDDPFCDRLDDRLEGDARPRGESGPLCDRLDDPFATASTIASRGMLGRAAIRAETGRDHCATLRVQCVSRGRRLLSAAPALAFGRRSPRGIVGCAASRSAARRVRSTRTRPVRDAARASASRGGCLLPAA